MEVKFTKEQEELFLKNYAKASTRINQQLGHISKAIAEVFLLECISDMISPEASNKLYEEMISDTVKASVDFLTK